MASLTIACPQCQAPLKLKDRSLLGKIGKCPQCSHRFVLKEESEVVLELADLNPPAVPSDNPFQKLKPKTESNNLADLFKDPPVDNSADPLAFLSGEVPTTSEPSRLTFPTDTSSSSSSSSSRRKKRRRSNGGGKLAMIVVLIALGLGGGLYYKSTLPKPAVETAAVTAAPAERMVVKLELPNAALEEFNAVKKKSPTKGEPIQLTNLPSGVRLIIHLRPAELWSSDRQFAEFRASLGPLATWFEQQINDISKQEPAAIEEMLIGLLLGPQGTPPELTATLRLKQPLPRADLLRIYSGQPLGEFNTEVRIDNGRAYRIFDDKNVTVAPAQYAEDLAAIGNLPALTAGNIEDVLKATDRDRLLTVVFDPEDIQMHTESLFPESAASIVEKTLRWLGDDAWAVAWSLHLSEDFYSELAVRSRNETGPAVLSKLYRERMQTMPELILMAVEKMNPQHSGYRQLIGRYPAMMKVLSLASQVGVDGRYIRIGALLPAKAGPNLALGTLLSWDESTRTDFTAQVATTVKMPAPSGSRDISGLPIRERLQQKMEIDFRNAPLQEAIDYIAGECKTVIDIDGDALKLAGFTKNMPQTLQISEATALQALYGIIKRYEKEPIPMVLQIDEANNKLVVMTAKFAEDQKIEVFDFKKNGF